MTATTPVCEDCIPSTSTLPSIPAPSSAPPAAPHDAILDPTTFAPPSVPAPAAAPPPAPYDAILDPTTFTPPSYTRYGPTEELPRVVVEFCDRCRWLSRATWTLTELFLTFPPTPTTGLKSISLLPRSAPETGGRFRVWLYRSTPATPAPGTEHWEGAELVWDRKIEGGFPEMKELKQRVRTLIEPTKSLGHSDKKGKDGRMAEVVGIAEGVKGLEIEGAKGEVEVKEEERETTVDDYAPRFRC